MTRPRKNRLLTRCEAANLQLVVVVVVVVAAPRASATATASIELGKDRVDNPFELLLLLLEGVNVGAPAVGCLVFSV